MISAPILPFRPSDRARSPLATTPADPGPAPAGAVPPMLLRRLEWLAATHPHALTTIDDISVRIVQSYSTGANPLDPAGATERAEIKALRLLERTP